MAITFGGTLPELRLDKRNVVTLAHTDGVGVDPDDVILVYPDGQTETFDPWPTVGSADFTRLICVVQPTKVAGPCQLLVVGTNDTVRYQVNVVRVTALEKRLGVRKRAFSLVDYNSTLKCPEGSAPNTMPDSYANTVTILPSREDSGGATLLNARKGGILVRTGPIFQCKVGIALNTDVNWVQFVVYREVSGLSMQVVAKSEKIGSVAGGADVEATIANGLNTYTLRRPLVGCRVGDYFGICFDVNATPRAPLSGTTSAVNGISAGSYMFLAAEPGAPGATDVFTADASTFNFNIHAYGETPFIVVTGDSRAHGASLEDDGVTLVGHGSVIDSSSFNPIDATKDPAIILANLLDVDAVANTGWGGISSGTLLTNVTARVLDLEPAVCVISIGGNNMHQQTSPLSGYAAFEADVFGANGIVQQLRNAGILPVLHNVGSFDESADTAAFTLAGGAENDTIIAQEIDRWKVKLRDETCPKYGVLLVDIHSIWGEPRASGPAGNLWDIAVPFITGMDGTHPLNPAYMLAMEATARVLLFGQELLAKTPAGTRRPNE